MNVNLLILLICLPSIFAFNISPFPNVIIKKPTLSNALNKQDRSSYFGFSINLRTDHILISAPRSQSIAVQQNDIYEPGAIYKCSVNIDSNCQPYIFDMEGNTFGVSKYTIDSEIKDNQTLGFAMDGHENGDDRFVVCAPNQRANTSDEYNVYGACYWVSSDGC
jgi:hypothetical protein